MSRRQVVQLAVGVTLLATFVFAGWYLTSSRFNVYVRERIVRELENVTGGKVDLKSLRWNLSKLEFEVHDVTIRGREGPNQLPLAHIDNLYLRAKVISLLGRELGFRRVVVDRPVIHILFYPDGTSNQPAPKVRGGKSRLPIDRLFDLAIDRLELRQGELLWNDRRIPLDVTANDVSLAIDYAALPRRYDGQLNIGKLDGKFRNYRPVNSTAEVLFNLTPTQAELKSVKWNSQKTKLEASGKINDFNNPRLEATYNLTIDLHQLGSVARVPQLRAGVVEVH